MILSFFQKSYDYFEDVDEVGDDARRLFNWSFFVFNFCDHFKKV